MPIAVTCSCGQKLKAPDNLAGKAVKCPKCKQPLKIPAAGPAPEIDLSSSSSLAGGLEDLFSQEMGSPGVSQPAGFNTPAQFGRALPPIGSQNADGFPKWMLWAGGGITLLLLLGLGIAMAVTSLMAGKPETAAQADIDGPDSDEIKSGDVASAFTEKTQPESQTPAKRSTTSPPTEQVSAADTPSEIAVEPIELTVEDEIASDTEGYEEEIETEESTPAELDEKLLKRIREQLENKTANLAPELNIDAKIETELRQTFEKLAEAYRRDVQDLFDDLIDEHRHAKTVMKEYLANGGNADTLDDEAITSQIVRESFLASDFKTDNKFLKFENYTLQRVELSPNQKTASVIVYLPGYDQASEKMCYWLRRDTGDWKFFDKERLSFAARASRDTADTIGSVEELQAQKPEDDAMKALRVAEESKDPVAIGHALDRLDAVAKRKLTHFVRLQARSLWYFHAADFQKALSFAEEAHGYLPQSPELYMQRAQAHNDLEQYEMAIRLLLTYQKRIGPDEVYWSEIGESLNGFELTEDAIAAWKRSLEYDPQYQKVIIRLALATLPENPEELKPYVSADKLDDATFAEIVKWFEEENNPEQLAALVKLREE